MVRSYFQNPIFHDEDKARAWFEARIWPDGQVCPRCGGTEDRIRRLGGKAHRAGLYQCNRCRRQFTATVGTFMERSRIQSTKWLLAVFLSSACKKRLSVHEISHLIGVSYKSTWFMVYRIRKAVRDPSVRIQPLGKQSAFRNSEGRNG